MINESIFGIEAPKFMDGSTEVLLDYAVVLRDEPEYGRQVLQSVIDGHRARKNQHYHWAFEVMINLLKYDEPKDKFDEIHLHKNALVTLWRTRDHDSFKNSSGTVVKFKFYEIIPTWIDSPIYPDRLILKFSSQDPIDISKNTVEI